MNDTYFMNNQTGELLPGEKAIFQFYTIEKHNILESWLDVWEDTFEPVENSVLTFPDFSNVF